MIASLYQNGSSIGDSEAAIGAAVDAEVLMLVLALLQFGPSQCRLRKFRRVSSALAKWRRAGQGSN